MIETRPATIEDAERISELLTANASDRGGALYGDWSIGVVTKWITDGSLIIVAMDGPKLVGALFTSEKAQASAPPVVAMLKAWPGSADAYVYGPVCIDQAARGQGMLEALYADVVARLPDREAILFSKQAIPARCWPTAGWGWCRSRISRLAARSSSSSAPMRISFARKIPCSH
jgi:hypothetical protein